MSERNITARLPVRALVLAVGVAVSSYGAVFHVAPAGKDANPGDATRPFATVNKAVAAVLPLKEPCEIIIREGTYPGDVRVGSNEDRLAGVRPHLLIRAAKKPDGTFEDVVFDGALKVEKAEPVTGRKGVFKFSARYSTVRKPHMWEADTRTRYGLVADLNAVELFPASFWFEGKDVFFHTSDGAPPEKHDIGATRGVAGITLWRPNVTVQGLKLRNFLAWRWSAGVEMRGADTAALDCEARNCTRGFQVMMEAPRTRVIRCRADDCAGGYYSQGRFSVVEDNRFYKVRDRFMVPAYPQDDCAIQFYSRAFAGTVRRNLCVGYANGIFMKCQDSKWVVEYNTCLDGKTHGIGCTKWHPESVYRYNIVTGYVWPILMPHALKPTTVVDYNCIWSVHEGAALRKCMEAPRKVGTGLRNMYADPRFAAPVTGDYRLLPDSPCLKMGPAGETAGAFGPVDAAFKDVQPPSLKVGAASPAKQAGGSGALFFERDPWLGGGRNQVRDLPPEGKEGEWVAPSRKVVLTIESTDAVSRTKQMRLRIGLGEWGPPEPFLAKREIELPDAARMTPVGVRVADAAGNWGPPASLLFRLADRAPRLTRGPVVYANDHGVVVSFETDSPCLAEMEYGPDLKYGSVEKQPEDVQRSWLSSDGGDWVEIRSRPRITNFIAVLSPKVAKGRTYHYRLVLRDEVGNRAETKDATFVVKGGPKTGFISAAGADSDAGGLQEAPWRTLQYAVDRALPGDRIVLLPGLYPGETTLRHGGIDGVPITIESEKAGQAVIDGRRDIKACINLEKAPHVVIKGLEMRWYRLAGVYIVDSPDVRVEGCRIWNDHWMGWPIGSGVFAHRSPGLAAHRNVMFQMERGIMLLQSPRSTITHNTILKNMYGALQVVFSAEGTISMNNSFCFSGNDQYVVNNRKPAAFETFVSDYNNVGTKLRNPEKWNKIVPEDPFFQHIGSKAVIGLNGRRYNSLEAWRKATGKDAHTIFKDPKYVNPKDRDFRLKPGSPNIGAGKDGVTIGAFGVKGK